MSVNLIAEGDYSLLQFGEGDVVGPGVLFTRQEFFDDGKPAGANGGHGGGGMAMKCIVFSV